jgi:O-antigen/teichoic acid export membrane protein
MQVNLIHRLENLPGRLSRLAVIPQAAQAVLEVLRGQRKELPRFVDSLALILARLASSGLGFLTWLVIARLFAAEQVGLASGLVSAMMLLVQLSLLGVGAAFITLYPRYRERLQHLLDTSLSLVAGAGILGAGGFILLSGRFFQELSIISQPRYAFLFLGMVLFGAVNTLMDHFSISIRRSDQALARNVLFGLVAIGTAAIFPLVLNMATSVHIIIAWALAGMSAVLLGAAQMWQSMSRYLYQPRGDRAMAGQLMAAGLPNYLLTLAERAPNWILPILVTELLSPADNAHWYILWMMAWAVYQITISLGQNLFADVTRHPEQVRQAVAYSQRTSLILAGSAGAFLFLFAPLVLSILGREYAVQGTLPLRVLSLAVFPAIFIQSYYAVCRGTSRLREATLTGLLSGLSGISAAAYAGINFGLPGMAVAWLAVQAVTGVWAIWRTRRLAQVIPGGVN